MVIGGIYTQTVNNTTTKVPMFGDLPVVGQLFRNNARSDQKPAADLRHAALRQETVGQR